MNLTFGVSWQSFFGNILSKVFCKRGSSGNGNSVQFRPKWQFIELLLVRNILEQEFLKESDVENGAWRIIYRNLCKGNIHRKHASESEPFKLLGHVIRMSDDRMAKKTLNRNFEDNRGRPWKRWINSSDGDEGVTGWRSYGLSQNPHGF